MPMVHPEQDGQGSKYLKPGEYIVRVKKFERRSLKDGRDIIVLKLEDVHGQGEIPLDLFNTEAAIWRIAKFALACGYKQSFNSDDNDEVKKAYLGRTAKIGVGTREYEKDGEKKTLSEVKSFDALNDAEKKEFPDMEPVAGEPGEPGGGGDDDEPLPF